MPRDTVLEKEITATPVSDDVLRVLEEGKRLIQRPEHWVQGPLAVNIARCEVDPYDADAVGFCSAGAVRRATLNLGLPVEAWAGAKTMLGRAARKLDPNNSNLIYFNDAPGRTHAEVMAMWDHAIAARRAEIAA